MKQYDTILFDLDGTLLDNAASFDWAYRTMQMLFPTSFSAANCPTKEDLIALYRAKEENKGELLDAYCKKTGWEPERSPEYIASFWCSLYLDRSVLYPESIPLLHYLRKKGYRLGLVTNGDLTRQNRKILTSGIDKMVDVCVISDAVGVAKPNPGILYIALEKLHASIPTTLFVGNSPDTDILAAKNAGMDSFLILGREPNFATYSGHLSDLFDLL